MCNGLVSLLPKQYASVHYTTADSVYIFNMTRFKKQFLFIYLKVMKIENILKTDACQ